MDLPEAHLEALNAAQEGIGLFDADLRLVVWNDAYAKVCDLPPKLLRRGMPFVDILGFRADRGDFDPVPRDQAIAALVDSAVRNDGQIHEIKLSDDRFIELRHTARSTGGFVALLRDVTRKRRTERALVDELTQHASAVEDLRSASAATKVAQQAVSSTTRRYLDAIETSLDGVAVFDADDRLVLWNRHYEDFYPAVAPFLAAGLRFEDVCRVFLEKRLVPEAAGREEAWLAERLTGHAELQCSYQRQLPNGRWVLFRERRTSDGGSVGIHIDITDLKQREAELSQARDRAEAANRAKSEFLANMSHELRTPLTAVMGFSEIIANESLGPVGVPAYREFARDIRDAGAHLLQIVSDVLDLSRIEADRLDLNVEPLDAATLAREVGNMVRSQAANAGVDLFLDMAEDAPPVMADAIRLRQALLNLVSNAIKFTLAGGAVALALGFDRDRNRVVFTITDSGIGIAEKDIEKVMQPFGQAEGAFSRRYQGIGLGLPLARRFVEAMAGELSLASELARGTTVTVDLPAQAAAPSHAAVEGPRSARYEPRESVGARFRSKARAAR